jgi:hypothetical protein
LSTSGIEPKYLNRHSHQNLVEPNRQVGFFWKDA